MGAGLGENRVSNAWGETQKKRQYISEGPKDMAVRDPGDRGAHGRILTRKKKLPLDSSIEKTLTKGLFMELWAGLRNQ